MSKQFHVMRKDGTEMRSVGSLGQAMEEMAAGYLMYLGTSADAVTISKALGRAGTGTSKVGTLLAIGEEAGPDRYSIFTGGKL
jgi:hypothetical protein